MPMTTVFRNKKTNELDAGGCGRPRKPWYLHLQYQYRTIFNTVPIPYCIQYCSNNSNNYINNNIQVVQSEPKESYDKRINPISRGT